MKRIAAIFISSLCIASFAQAAEMQSRKEPQAVAAPTQPVAARALDAPAIESDTRNIQAILNREGDAPVKSETKPAAKKSSSSEVQIEKSVAPPPPVVIADKSDTAVPAADTPSFMQNLLTHIRVFAIRWFEVAVITLLALIVGFCAVLSRAFRQQNLLLARSLRLIEDTARNSQRLANQADPLPDQPEPRPEYRPEGRVVKMKRPAENQPTLDLL